MIRLGFMLGAICLALFAASLCIGPVPIGPSAVLSALDGLGDPAATLIVREIRLPRALLAVIVGAGLGLSGAALQGLLRNPLADPGVIGVSSTAGLFAVVVFYSGLAASVPLALPLGAMLGALIAVLLLFALAGRDGGSLGLVLAGAGINALAAALTSLALNLAPSPFAVSELVFWMLGSFADRSLDHVALAAPPIGVGAVLLLVCGRRLDALLLGEDVAASLGIGIASTRMLVVVGAALSVGPGVAVAGSIGFVGLAVPHLLRPLVGARPSRILPLSGLAGAALTLASDLAVRLVPTQTELKLGVVTAIVGAPLFLALLMRLRRSGELHA